MDDKKVIASVASGYFLAWWPSGSGVAQVEAFDATGRSLAKDDGGQ